MVSDVTQVDIVQGLRALGLDAGDGVMVHASLKSFGLVAGGPAAVVAALQEVLTPAGTLLMPSFNHGAPFGPGGPGRFDPLATPTTNGAIPDFFWRQPGVRRSLDPTHAFAAWGKNAERYTASHHRTLTVGPGSPLGLLLADGGHGLLLGVDYRANTFQHVAETMAGAPCLGRRTEEYPLRLPDGRVVPGRTWGWRSAKCPLTDGERYGPEMAGHERQARIGACRAVLFRLADCLAVLSGILARGRSGIPPCRACPIRPRVVAATVASDWDENRQCPRPDSRAWTY